MPGARQSLRRSRLGLVAPKYLWPPEGFYCPKHSVVIQEGIRAGDFKDWPLDTDPEVLETLEGIAKFAPLDSAKGQRLLRKADAAMRRVNRKLKPQHNRNIAAARARAPALETAHMGGKPLKPQ